MRIWGRRGAGGPREEIDVQCVWLGGSGVLDRVVDLRGIIVRGRGARYVLVEVHHRDGQRKAHAL